MTGEREERVTYPQFYSLAGGDLRRDARLSLFVQRVGQGDGESPEDVPAQTIAVLDWNP
jgi:hypothetical protein